MWSQNVSMGIWYGDQRDNVADRHLEPLLARLTISLTIAEYIRHTQVDDQLPKQCFVQETYSRLVKDVDGQYKMRG